MDLSNEPLPVFLDECGYTGEDLANSEQPFFIIVTHAFAEAEAKALLHRHFATVRSAELKHADLVKRGTQRAMVLGVLDELRPAAARIKISLIDKQFALLTKIVDLIIEPAMYEGGVDLYEHGGNIALSNLLNICLPVFGGPDLLPSLLVRFQRMMRERTKDAYDAFFRPLFEEEHPPKVDDLLMYIKAGHMEVGPERILATPKRALDVSMASAFVLVHSWRQEVQRELVLLHDRSSNMQKDRALWEALVSPEAPAATVGYDRRSITFPIGVTETKFEDSKAWCGLQLADVLAGAMFYWARWRAAGREPVGTYGTELEKRFSDWELAHLIQPTMAVTPSELGTEGPKKADSSAFIGQMWSDKGLI